MNRIYAVVFLLTFLCVGCVKEEPISSSSGPSNTWVIPQEEILRGAAKDAIKSIDNPTFLAAHEAAFLSDEDRLLVLALPEGIRAYPIQILNWHEIINDQLGDDALTVTYCPLTATGIAWINDSEAAALEFGVSGLLYQANMIAYDRETDSHWSQMRLQCVNGSEVGTRLRQQVLITLSWQQVKRQFPKAQILSDKTGFDLPYSSYPYGDYRENNDFFISPVDFNDHRLNAKDEMMGVILLGEATVFPKTIFSDQEITLKNLVIAGQPLVLCNDPINDFMVVYKSNFGGKVHNFLLDHTSDEYLLVDEDGNRYDIFGRGDNGETVLQSPRIFSGFWFAWTKFYPRVEIYGG